MKSASFATRRVILFIREIEEDINSRILRTNCVEKIILILSSIREVGIRNSRSGRSQFRLSVKADIVGWSAFVYKGGHGWGFPAKRFYIYRSRLACHAIIHTLFRCLLHRFKYHQHAVSYVWLSRPWRLVESFFDRGSYSSPFSQLGS